MGAVVVGVVGAGVDVVGAGGVAVQLSKSD
jgi:hypothetical protein